MSKQQDKTKTVKNECRKSLAILNSPLMRPKMCTVEEKSLDSSGDQQEKSNVFRVLEKLQNGKHSAKSGLLVDLSKRLALYSLHNVCKNFLPGRLIHAD